MPKRSPPSPEPTRTGHPIAVVAQRTGLSRDVLRVWERRYGAVEPARTPGRQRLYSDEDVVRFRLLAAATQHGRNIGQVARLSADELRRLVAEDERARPAAPATAGNPHSEIAESAMALIRALDAAGLDRELRRAIARHGLRVFLEDTVPELMQRVGDEWHANRLSIAHEHLASAAVLTIVLDTMRAVPETPGAPRLVVATPAGGRHALGAAVAAATAAIDGWTVVYLGVDVPASDIVGAAAVTGAHAVAMSVVYAESVAVTESDLRAVRAALPARVPLVVGGAAVAGMPALRSTAGIVVCASIADLRAVLVREKAVA